MEVTESEISYIVRATLVQMEQTATIKLEGHIVVAIYDLAQTVRTIIAHSAVQVI